MVEDACSSQQTQCPSGADFIFVGERGLERLLQRESSSQQTQCPSGADFIFVGECGLERLLQRERTFDSNASIFVDVHLLSGRRAAVEVDADASVESLKHRAQSALAVPSRGRLLNSSGEVLDGAQTVAEAMLRSGDVLTLHVNQVQLKANRKSGRSSAFAALLGDRFVVTWGSADYGGNSRAVQERLRDVQQIQASHDAFAAIRSDGSVVTWGFPSLVPKQSVQEQLRDVQQIQSSLRIRLAASRGVVCGSRASASTSTTFAAIWSDGSVVSWGATGLYGGASSAVQEQLRDVQQIQASDCAFAAIRSDGSVVTWGEALFGGDSSAVQEQLRDVQQIQSGVMDLSSPGGPPTMAMVPSRLLATAVRYRSSCEMCSRSKLLLMPLLQSGVMDLSSPGGQPALVATAVRYRSSCEMCSRSKLLMAMVGASALQTAAAHMKSIAQERERGACLGS